MGYREMGEWSNMILLGLVSEMPAEVTVFRKALTIIDNILESMVYN